MVDDGLYLVLRVLIDKIWGWSRVIGSVGGGLPKRGQQRGVEDVMNPPRGGKVELEGNWGNDPSDAEWSLPSRRELIGLIGQHQVLSIKPHLISDLENLLDDVWGSRGLIDGRRSLRPLSMEQVQARLNHLVRGVDHSSRVEVWAVAEEGFVGGHTQGGVGAVVVDSGGDSEPFVPVILLGGGKQAEVLFNPLILPFGQPVRLRVESSRQILSDS